MPTVTKSWIGGTPRVTISRRGSDVAVKLLGSKPVRGTIRQERANIGRTGAIDSVLLSPNDPKKILSEALRLSRQAGNCWVWDSCNSGAADLYNNDPPFFDDPINF